MTIKNYNDDIRQKLVSKYDEISVLSDGPNAEENFIENLQTYYDSLKKEKDFKYVMGILYSSFYTLKRFSIKDFEDEEEENVTDNVILGVNNVDELISLCDDDICSFYDLISANSVYYRISYEDRRQYIKKINDEKEMILKIFPSYIVDIIYYLNTYNKNEIFETYLAFKDMYNNDNDAKKDTVSLTSEILIKMKDNDYYNYKFLMLEFIEDYYKYINYSINNNKNIDEDSKRLIGLIEEDLDFFVNIASNRMDLLGMVLNGFLEYILLSNDDIYKINKYYDSNDINKKYIKLLKTSEKLKKSNI